MMGRSPETIVAARGRSGRGRRGLAGAIGADREAVP